MFQWKIRNNENQSRQHSLLFVPIYVAISYFNLTKIKSNTCVSCDVIALTCLRLKLNYLVNTRLSNQVEVKHSSLDLRLTRVGHTLSLKMLFLVTNILGFSLETCYLVINPYYAKSRCISFFTRMVECQEPIYRLWRNLCIF